MVRGEASSLITGSYPREIFPGRAEQRPPHITLFGPFTLCRGASPGDIMDCIEHLGRDRSPPLYRLSGLIGLRGRKGEALALEIIPDDQMKELYYLLSNRLRALAHRSTWIDRRPRLRRLHITLAFNMRAGEADRIRAGIARPIPRTMPQAAARITLVRNGALWYEYDLALHRWLTRAASFAVKD